MPERYSAIANCDNMGGRELELKARLDTEAASEIDFVEWHVGFES